jgi:SPP1 family phage portal protein
MIRVDETQTMNPSIIEYLIKEFKINELPRLEHLGQYYVGNQEILNRTMEDVTKPNNKAVNPYANFITDMFTGYFLGSPIRYKTTTEEVALEELKLIFELNNEADQNTEIGKDASVYGRAYEMLYVDFKGSTRFKKVSPMEVITIYDNTIEEELLYTIRFYSATDIMGLNAHTIAEVYSRDSITIYKGGDNFTTFEMQTEKPHYFGLVPFVEYKNNGVMLGDFELVIPLIDSYDKLESDTLNDFEAFTDAYLSLSGVDADSEDIKTMKENRVMLLPQGASASFLTKNVNDASQENLKSRIDSDIHKFSKCPDLTDQNFAGTSSGVAMKYKLMGFENVASIKESKFKKGIQRRIELISNVMSMTSTGFDYRSIELVFVRNIPSNSVEIADVVNKLRGLLSKETLIAQVPFVKNVQDELLLIKNEVAIPSVDSMFAETSNTDTSAK